MVAWLRRLFWGFSEQLSAYDLAGGVMSPHNESDMLQRARLLREAGARVGQTSTVGQISVYGRADQLEIGNNCHIQHRVTIVTDGWAAVDRPGHWRGTQVRIMDNCAIFRGCWIMPGVTIGPSALIVPGSVVARDIPAGYVAMGEPARPIMTMDMWAERCESMRNTHPGEFSLALGGRFGFHSNLPTMVAGWIEVIRAQREARGASMAGLPTADQLKMFTDAGRLGQGTTGRGPAGQT